MCECFIDAFQLLVVLWCERILLGESLCSLEESLFFASLGNVIVKLTDGGVRITVYSMPFSVITMWYLLAKEHVMVEFESHSSVVTSQCCGYAKW